MSLEEVRVQAERFEKRMRRTYNREFLAAIITILWMGAYIWFLKPVPLRVAAGLSIPAILLMLYQLRQQASPRTLPQDLGLISSVEFLRTQLERQRDARQNIWHWYLLPFVPVVLVWALPFTSCRAWARSFHQRLELFSLWVSSLSRDSINGPHADCRAVSMN